MAAKAREKVCGRQLSVANLEGRAGSVPPPFGEGLTPSLTVMLTNATFWSFYCKHGTQSIQNDCHQLIYDSFRVHQIRFRPRLRPGPHWGSLQRSPDPPAGLRDPISKGEGRRARGDRRRRGEEGNGRDWPPFANSWIRPWWRNCLNRNFVAVPWKLPATVKW